MKSSSLIKQLLTGFVLSLFASICIASLSLVLNINDAFYLGFLATTILYIGFILSNSQIKTGRVVVFICSVGGAALVGLFVQSTEVLLGSSLFSIFLIRVIYYQKGLASAAFDAALICFGFFVSSGVLVSTQSWFLCFWCFFFIQSFVVYGPLFMARNGLKQTKQSIEKSTEQTFNQNFNQARNTANQAIEMMSSENR